MTNRKPDKYNLLIETAKTVFAEKGFHQTKIKDITDAASLAAGTFYIYFKNKNELISALFMKYANIFLEKCELVADLNLNPNEKLKQFLITNMDCIYENKEFFKIHYEHINSDKENNPIKNYKEIIDRYYNSAERILNEGIESGDFDPNINPVVTARCIRGMTLIPFLNFMILHSEFEPEKDDIYNSIIQLFFKGITNAK